MVETIKKVGEQRRGESFGRYRKDFPVGECEDHP